MLFLAYGRRWFGPPVLLASGSGLAPSSWKILDGRIRIEALGSLAEREVKELPIVRVQRPTELAKMLILAEHWDRAREVWSEQMGGDFDPLFVSGMVGLPIEQVLPLVAAEKKKVRNQPGTIQVRRERVIDRVRRLFWRANLGEVELSTTRLEEALGEYAWNGWVGERPKT